MTRFLYRELQLVLGTCRAEQTQNCGRALQARCQNLTWRWRDLNWKCCFNGTFSLSPFLQVPSLCEDLLSSVDQPLKIARDKVVGKDYLLCDYNRDGDSYR